MELHIGEMIKEKSRERRIGPTELGGKINTSKQNVYGIFKRKSIDTNLLLKISKALSYNFFLDYSAQMGPETRDGSSAEAQKLKEELRILQERINGLEKENSYLNKINGLLEDRIRQCESS